VFEFQYAAGGPDRFGRDDNLALAFAARTTSCFPGAFPPVSVSVFKGYLPGVKGDFSRFFRLYEVSGADVEKTYFVDGGVLDNRPFGHVIKAVRQKRAEVEVDRRLLYLEPDPGGPAAPPPGREPHTIEAVLGAVSGIPRREPILDDLLDVTELNEQVQRIKDVVEFSFDRIAAKTEGILKEALESSAPPDATTMGRWQRQLNEEARKDAGTAFATYIRSKISGAVDRLATTACNVCEYPTDANHALLVRAVYRSWAEQAGLFDQAAEPSEEQVQFLRAFDLDFGIRRLQFVLAGLNAWYSELGNPGIPPRAELDAVKTRLWQAIVDLRETMSGRRFTPELSAGLIGCFPEKDIAEFVEKVGFEPRQFVEQRQSDLDALQLDLRTFFEESLKGFNARLLADVVELTNAWEWETRKQILIRFLGFPFWDILLYPIQSVAGAGERDAVEVIRMSPRDTSLLKCRPAAAPSWTGSASGTFEVSSSGSTARTTTSGAGSTPPSG
jgi:patatin-related protein